MQQQESKQEQPKLQETPQTPIAHMPKFRTKNIAVFNTYQVKLLNIIGSKVYDMSNR